MGSTIPAKLDFKGSMSAIRALRFSKKRVDDVEMRFTDEYIMKRGKYVLVVFDKEDRKWAQMLRGFAMSEKFGFGLIDCPSDGTLGKRWKGMIGSRMDKASALVLVVSGNTRGNRAINWTIREALRMKKIIVAVTAPHDKSHPLPEAAEDAGLSAVPWDTKEAEKAIRAS